MRGRPASGRRPRSRVEARTRSGCPTRSRSACGSRASPIQATTSTSRLRRPTCSAASTSSSRRCATLQPDRRCGTRSGRSTLPGLMRIARRLQDLAQSDIRRMTRECERVSGLNLGQGICDLPTPPLFREGARELRDAIATKLARDNGLRADPASEICVTVGASGAYAAAISALLDPGDGILLFEPYYGYHLNAALVTGLTPEFATLTPPHFTLQEETLEAAITARTRAMVICTPSNPSGKMFSREELSIVSRVAQKRDLLVITDEIYEYIRYDGRPHVSPASIPGLRERAVSIMGLSKTFSITGWRLGYAVAPEEMTRAITLVNDLYFVCAPTPL